MPGTFPVRLITILLPEHDTGEAGTTVNTEGGLTVTVTVIGLPVQPFAEGVITYITSCGALEVFVSVWLMLSPDPLLNPVMTPGPEAVHENVVPVTVDEIGMLVIVPEHNVTIDCVTVATGSGLTYTV
jgi:hypothetical protein